MPADLITQAARVIRTGGIVAYPTEAVFGLGCDPSNEAALQRLLRLKNRPAEKGLILIAAEYQQLEGYLEPLTNSIRQRVLASWPGPITWLIPAHREVSKLLRGQHATLAVRVTAHTTSAALCRSTATAIVSTSANPSGCPPARTAEQVKAYFGNRIDFILDKPLGDATVPSTIRDAISGRIIRPG